MDIETPAIFRGTTTHARLFPVKNAFKYRLFYLALPLSKLSNAPIRKARFSWMSFHSKDHGYRDERDLHIWARDILSRYDVANLDGEIVLLALPRIFGYVFNPVSFWLCHDRSGVLKAVIAEVNNTFRESHTYLCKCDGNGAMRADKVFHVSPFLERSGHYDFKFDYTPAEHFTAFIDFYYNDGRKQLVTNLKGTFTPMTRRALICMFFAYPLVTFKAITLIHYQAVKLLWKKVKYIPKPEQHEDRTSVTNIPDE